MPYKYSALLDNNKENTQEEILYSQIFFLILRDTIIFTIEYLSQVPL